MICTEADKNINNKIKYKVVEKTRAVKIQTRVNSGDNNSWRNIGFSDLEFLERGKNVDYVHTIGFTDDSHRFDQFICRGASKEREKLIDGTRTRYFIDDYDRQAASRPANSLKAWPRERLRGLILA